MVKQESGCASGCALAAAALCGIIALWFFGVGASVGWTSDGPAMLIVMIGFVGFGLLAVFLFLGALGLGGEPD